MRCHSRLSANVGCKLLERSHSVYEMNCSRVTVCPQNSLQACRCNAKQLMILTMRNDSTSSIHNSSVLIRGEKKRRQRRFRKIFDKRRLFSFNRSTEQILVWPRPATTTRLHLLERETCRCVVDRKFSISFIRVEAFLAERRRRI